MPELTYKINYLSVADYQRIKSAQIPFGNSITILGGRNAQGKSSAIDCLISIIGGQKYVNDEPVRNGAEHGEGTLNFDTPDGPLTAVRTFQPDGSSTLKITDRFGKKVQESPQTLMNRIFGLAGIDPLAFMNGNENEQVERMLKLLGLDFTEVDQLRDKAYTDRHAQNLLVDTLQKRYKEMQAVPEGTPDAEVSITDLSNELGRRKAHNAGLATLALEAKQKADRVTYEAQQLSMVQLKIDDLKKQLIEQEAKKTNLEELHKLTKEASAEAQSKVTNFKPEPTEELESQLAGAEAINQAVRNKKAVEAAAKECEAARLKAEEYTNIIDACDQEKARLLSEAKWPVKGLSIEGKKLYLNGAPFSQASSAEQLSVSVPLAFAASPLCKYAVIREGSLLDDDHIALVAGMAEQAVGNSLSKK